MKKPIERLFQYFDYKYIRYTAFEKEIGVSNGYFHKTHSRLANMNTEIVKKIIDNCPDLSLEWLVLGVGNMLRTEEQIRTVAERKEKTKSKENVPDNLRYKKTKSKENVHFEKEDNNEDILQKNEKCRKPYTFTGTNTNIVADKKIQTFNLRTDHQQEKQNIPLYNFEAFAGLVPLFNDAASQEPIDYINIPNLPKCDGAIYVTGDSMYPLLKSGDIVLYKQIADIENNIFWGEMYLISINMEGEEYVTVKYIQKSEMPKYIKLVSHNKHHSDKNVRIDKINALAFVKASIRINSMK